MRPIQETAYPEVQQNDGSFTQCTMGQLDAGDVFRLRNPNGTLRVNEEGVSTFKVLETPRIQCEEVL